MKFLVSLKLLFIFLKTCQAEQVLTISNGYDFLKYFDSTIKESIVISDEFPAEFRDAIGDLNSSNYWYFQIPDVFSRFFANALVVDGSYINWTMRYFVINVELRSYSGNGPYCSVPNNNSTTGVLNVCTKGSTVDYWHTEIAFEAWPTWSSQGNIFILDEITISSDGTFTLVPYFPTTYLYDTSSTENIGMTSSTMNGLTGTEFMITTTETSKEETCPRNCNQTGWCASFKRCVKDTPGNEEWRWDSETEWYVGVWEEVDCPGDLYWNPESDSGPNGSCDKLENLTPARRRQYKMDVKCWEPCYWEEHEEVAERCSGKYWYANRIDESHRLLEPLQLKQCPDGLIFNKGLETCTLCKDLSGTTKTECCPESGQKNEK